jgi:hypothetical protein
VRWTGDVVSNSALLSHWPDRRLRAFAALEYMAHGHGIRLPGGGLTLVDARTPKSMHVAFPNVGYTT